MRFHIQRSRRPSANSKEFEAMMAAKQRVAGMSYQPYTASQSGIQSQPILLELRLIFAYSLTVWKPGPNRASGLIRMFESAPICTYLIIAVTVWVTYLGFKSLAFEQKYIFNPEAILAGKEFYRLVTSAFLHSGWPHLIFNMFSLYMFAQLIELYYGRAELLGIYFGAIVGGSLLSLYVHRHHVYQAYGASGGVCGVIFAYMLLFPGGTIRMLYLPVGIPAWLYAIGYIAYSFYGMKENLGKVGHDAHLGGAIVGLLIAAGLHPDKARDNLTIFLIVFFAAVLLLIYLWRNPMFLPLAAVLRSPFSRKKSTLAALPKHKRENLEMDAILDKIAQKGINSLTRDEKAMLDRMSGEYQRRADSKKPESGLAI
jgi:membrane associated rhomboid family serine protease